MELLGIVCKYFCLHRFIFSFYARFSTFSFYKKKSLALIDYPDLANCDSLAICALYVKCFVGL